MISDWELWAAANMLMRKRGEDAEAFIASRVESLILGGDLEGAVTMQAIGDRVTLLRDEAAGKRSVH